ncbi:hypothetical protein CQ12_31120 [Bradyrhizobium jicamae]|uniref:Uncharacterized protein n=1 Tax=Bradyrhizobium jicamae TaxID=280332 RepID=A0A0R3L3P1_9BRAD|nr:hypothetical protein [Bradyrhizobium jicamae]KRR01582.1 hypothetical protein CQ12_31120 [Bradyrhizobium jicamae]
MLNYLKKFAVDIFPSVAATVIGAYIVNHYIVSKPATDAPPAAAVSPANPKGDGKAEAKSDTKSDAKPAESTASNLPAAGVKARGISEKAIMEKTAAERPAVAEKAQKADEKAEAKADPKSDANKSDANKSDVKSAESPADADRRHAAAPREKEKIRVVLPSPIQPLNSQPVNSSPAPVAVAPPAPAAPVETSAAPEERRDANDLARAAIERLRANGETSPRVAEPARASEAPKVANAPVVAAAPAVTNAPVTAHAPALRPLPPPIMVSGSPVGEPYGQASSGQPSSQARPPYADAGNPNRPIPPADIPLSRPIDLRAEVAEPSVRDRATAAAEDALSTAKSIFHSVLPR